MRKAIVLLLALLMTASLGFAGGGQEPGRDAETAPAPQRQLTEGGLPRSETVIAAMLTGRVGSPTNFNEWVGWKNRDRGMQQLMNEPLWSVDFATGEIINGLAAGEAQYNSDFTRLTIPLREGVKWSDGVDFTAEDVVFTVELLSRIPGFNSHSVMAENVASVRAASP